MVMKNFFLYLLILGLKIIKLYIDVNVRILFIKDKKKFIKNLKNKNGVVVF